MNSIYFLPKRAVLQISLTYLFLLSLRIFCSYMVNCYLKKVILKLTFTVTLFLKNRNRI